MNTLNDRILKIERDRLERYWSHRIAVFKITGSLEDGDASKFKDDILKISTEIQRNIQDNNYNIIGDLIKKLDIVLDSKEQAEGSNKEVVIGYGLLSLIIFVKNSPSKEELIRELSKCVPQKNYAKDNDEHSPKKYIQAQWEYISNKLIKLSKTHWLDAHFEKNYIRGDDNIMWQSSYDFCKLLIWIYRGEDIENNTKDALMLVVEKKDKGGDPRKSEILLLIGKNEKSEYVKNRYVFPAIQVPKFPLRDPWKNEEKQFVNMNYVEAMFKEINNMNRDTTHNMKPIVYFPTGRTGNFVIMLIQLSDWGDPEKIREFYTSHALPDKIKDGPFPYETVEWKSYEDLWTLIKQKKPMKPNTENIIVYYRTIFYVACVMAKAETDSDKRIEILETARDEINYQANRRSQQSDGNDSNEGSEDAFDLIYINNKDGNEWISDLLDDFENLKKKDKNLS